MKKNGFSLILIMVLVLVSLVSIYFFSKSTKNKSVSITQPEISSWKTYVNQEAGFSFKYPEEFVSVKNSSDSGVVSFEKDGYYLDFQVEEFSKYISWIKMIKEDLQEKNLNVRSQKVSGRDVYLESRQSSGSIFGRNIFIVNGSSIIRIQVAADENKVSNVYNKVENLADQILSTFVFSDSSSSERIDQPTLHGGAYSIAYFSDDKGNPVMKGQATQVEIVEYSKDGIELFRTHGFIKE
jgi:uncharacterized protein (UPF0333 family)